MKCPDRGTLQRRPEKRLCAAVCMVGDGSRRSLSRSSDKDSLSALALTSLSKLRKHALRGNLRESSRRLTLSRDIEQYNSICRSVHLQCARNPRSGGSALPDLRYSALAVSQARRAARYHRGHERHRLLFSIRVQWRRWLHEHHTDNCYLVGMGISRERLVFLLWQRDRRRTKWRRRVRKLT